MTQSPGEFKPSRRDVLRPAEYVGGAAIAAVFTGVIVLLTTRDLTLTFIIAGIAFIAVLVVLALLAMTMKPNAEETAEIDGTDDPGRDDPRSPGDPGSAH